MRRWLARHLPSIVLFVALLALWQLASTSLGIREYILPSPAVGRRARSSRERFRGPPTRGRRRSRSSAPSCWRAAAGVALGVAIAWSPLLASALMPFLVFVNTLPKVAVAPLFLLWLGYGIVPNMLIGALIGFFPVVINTAVGLSQVDPEMLDLGRVFNAPKWRVFAKIRIPNALSLHPERAQGHRHRRRRGRHRRRVRRLPAGARLRHHHHPGQHEHAGGLRRPGLDLGRSVSRVYGAVVLAARWIAPWAEISD